MCPIITQLLRSVDEGLTQEYSEHISIISITVDPERDTPEVLQDFTELHGVIGHTSPEKLQTSMQFTQVLV